MKKNGVNENGLNWGGCLFLFLSVRKKNVIRAFDIFKIG